MRKAEVSIALIVAAVIGLILIVVIVAMISGKLGAFGKGTDDSAASSAQSFFNTCVDACKIVGKVKSAGDETSDSCKSSIVSSLHPQVLPGSYDDVPSGKVCCCKYP